MKSYDCLLFGFISSHLLVHVNNPWIQFQNRGRRNISTVIVDEVHEIGKDRGFVVDDILYYTFWRKVLYKRKGGVHPGIVAMSGTLPTWMVERLWVTYPTLFVSSLCVDDDSNIEGPQRVFLPEMKTAKYYPFVREILKAKDKKNIIVKGESGRITEFIPSYTDVYSLWIHLFAHKEEDKNEIPFQYFITNNAKFFPGPILVDEQENGETHDTLKMKSLFRQSRRARDTTRSSLKLVTAKARSTKRERRSLRNQTSFYIFSK